MAADSNQVKEIFLKASELTDAAARAAFLEGACGGDGSLRRRVESLLAAHDQIGEFLERDAVSSRPSDVSDATDLSPENRDRSSFAQTLESPLDATEDFGEEPSHATHGEVGAGTVIVGRYTLVRVLGEGGMGVVYLANQHSPVKRQVALKLIRKGMDSKTVLARFDAERQALALMDHPNIARVYDGGTTAEGQPFFVMELVEGSPLTDYCDRNRLPIRTRLEMFVNVCRAVQHAHQKGIIHRDLKPSNVLVAEVDGRPTPKVIDFGVAIAPELQLTELSFVDAGAIVGTPTYMSPEQADPTSKDIDTRTDVYALGAMLYELLTGSPPIDARQFKRGAILEMMRMVREVDPPRPSTRLSTADDLPNIAANRSLDPARLADALRGDLDWVVMKALEKDRTRRYETANGLARDIQRFLADEVVEARPPTTGYRLRKFASRHRGEVIAVSLVLVALLVGIVATSAALVRALKAEASAISNAQEADRQSKLARQGFDESRQAVDRAFTVVSESRLLQVPGMHSLRKQLLDEALQYYRAFAARWSDEPSLRRDLAVAYFRVAAITGEISSKTQAIKDYEESRRCCELVLQADPLDLESARTRGTCFNNIGKLLMEQHKFAESLAAFDRCYAVRKELTAQHPNDPRIEDDLASCRGNMALVLDHLGRRSEAFGHVDAAVAILRKRLTADPGQSDYRHELAGLLDTRAGLLVRDRRYEEGAAGFRDAIQHELQAVKSDPASTYYRLFLGNHYFNLALVCENHLKRIDDAVAARKDAIQVWERLAAENPAVTEFRGNLAQGCVDLGNTLLYRGKGREDPMPYYERARDVLVALTDELPEVGRNFSSLGAVYDGIAYHQLEIKQPERAVESLKKAVAQQRRAIELAPELDQFHRFLSSHLMNLSRAYKQLNRSEQVLETLNDAIPELERVLRDAPNDRSKWRDLGSAHHTAGEILAAAGKHAEAFAAHRRGLDVWKREAMAHPDEDDALDAATLTFDRLADDLSTAGLARESASLREAEASFWTELKAKAKSPARSVVARGRASLSRGELAVEEQDWNGSLSWFRRSLVDLREVLKQKPNDSDVASLLARTLKWTGDVQFVQKDSIGAARDWEESLTVYRRLLAASSDPAKLHGIVGALLHNLGRVSGDAGDHRKALEYYRDAVNHQSVAFEKSPDKAREWLDNHYVMLINTHRQLKQFDEAVAAVRKRVALKPDDSKHLVSAAGQLGKLLPTAKDEKAKNAAAEECVALLRKAAAAGFKEADQLVGNPDFGLLQSRDDFKQLVSTLKK